MSASTGATSSASVYTTPAFWERLWRTAGIQSLGLFIIGYVIYGYQPHVGASAATGGSLTTLGYSAGRKSTIDVTDLIWKRASMKSFSLFAQPAEAWGTAWSVISPLLQSSAVKPIVAKTFPLSEAEDALRYLVEGRPFGKVVLSI